MGEGPKPPGARDTLEDPKIWISTPRDALARLGALGGVLGGKPVANKWRRVAAPKIRIARTAYPHREKPAGAFYRR